MRRILAVSLAAAFALPLDAQTSAAVASWIHLDAVPGTEAATARTLLAALPGWHTDPWGNLIKTMGSGSPRRVMACALDYSAYVVSQVTGEGYIRLRRTGVPSHPLWNQFQEAQRVAVITAGARVSGVVAVANGHFARQHVADSTVLTADQLWVDVGASSRAEVDKLGIALLDPVMPDRPLWTFGAYATGPAAGARAGCAAVAAAAAFAPATGETTFILSTQSIFGWVGLSAALAKMGKVDDVALTGAGRSANTLSIMATSRLEQPYRALVGRVKVDSVLAFAPLVRWPGSTVESIDSIQAIVLLRWVAKTAGLATVPPFVAISADTARRLTPRTDAYGALEREFMVLADIPAVAGHERLMREAVLAALPTWARAKAQVDSAGNIVVTAGPDRDAMAMIAHMDEVGFEVDRILPDGRVTLRTRGGAVLPSWEGVPAYLHFDEGAREPLRGVFVPRDSARTKRPPSLQAWFGLDSAQLVARGVKPGLSLTAYKRAARLAGARITGRSSDDRTGTGALLAAVRAIDPARLKRRVHFVWTVQEEGGLNGARAFGNKYGTSLQRVYAVDTFVSSDSPLESPHFAFAPLGQGAVLRGLDDGSLAPRAERERIVRVARANGIALQIGTTQGSTDGSAITPWGPPNVGLSWPGRYSHGPAEVFDLRDVSALARLIAALAVAP